MNETSSCLPNTDYLISRAEVALGSIDKMKKGQADYVKDMKGKCVIEKGGIHTAADATLCSCFHSDAGALLKSLTHFSHAAADTIVNGSATAHMAPTDHADRKRDAIVGCACKPPSWGGDL